MARRLTQQDIARMAGVSQTTVSLVLNNRAV
ncbi:LacI family DNA-binding transcriptional regulator, partial [Streptosporangium fragile]